MSSFTRRPYKGSVQHFLGGGEFRSFHEPIDAKASPPLRIGVGGKSGKPPMCVVLKGKLAPLAAQG